MLTSLLILLVYYTRSGGKSGGENVSLRGLLGVSLGLAESAGQLVKQVHESARLNALSKGKTKEGAVELRTDADLRSHRLIVGGLQKFHSGLKIISEEHDADEGKEEWTADTSNYDDLLGIPDENVPVSDVAVWVDPLDATQEFTENMLEYVTIMVCVAVKGRPVIGVIHEPFSKNTVWGWVNKASSKNLNVVDPPPASQLHRIVVSRSHAGQVTQIALTAFGNRTKVIPAGGSGYKTLQVIRGLADAYVHVTLIKKWDVCAPNAVLSTLKGVMTNLDGEPISYAAEADVVNRRGIVATLHHHDEYLYLLKKTTPKT